MNLQLLICLLVVLINTASCLENNTISKTTSSSTNLTDILEIEYEETLANDDTFADNSELLMDDDTEADDELRLGNPKETVFGYKEEGSKACFARTITVKTSLGRPFARSLIINAPDGAAKVCYARFWTDSSKYKYRITTTEGGMETPQVTFLVTSQKGKIVINVEAYCK